MNDRMMEAKVDGEPCRIQIPDPSTLVVVFDDGRIIVYRNTEVVEVTPVDPDATLPPVPVGLSGLWANRN